MKQKDHEVLKKVLILLEEEYQPEFDQNKLGPVNFNFVKFILKLFVEELEKTISERVMQTPINQILQEDQH